MGWIDRKSLKAQQAFKQPWQTYSRLISRCMAKSGKVAGVPAGLGFLTPVLQDDGERRRFSRTSGKDLLAEAHQTSLEHARRRNTQEHSCFKTSLSIAVHHIPYLHVLSTNSLSCNVLCPKELQTFT